MGLFGGGARVFLLGMRKESSSSLASLPCIYTTITILQHCLAVVEELKSGSLRIVMRQHKHRPLEDGRPSSPTQSPPLEEEELRKNRIPSFPWFRLLCSHRPDVVP